MRDRFAATNPTIRMSLMGRIPTLPTLGREGPAFLEILAIIRAVFARTSAAASTHLRHERKSIRVEARDDCSYKGTRAIHSRFAYDPSLLARRNLAPDNRERSVMLLNLARDSLIE